MIRIGVVMVLRDNVITFLLTYCLPRRPSLFMRLHAGKPWSSKAKPRILHIILALVSIATSGLESGAMAASRSDLCQAPQQTQNGFGSDMMRIPVATASGIILMNHKEYQAYTKGMKHLPVLSRSYVFGHTIPFPQTDQHGHIRLSGTHESEAPAPRIRKGDEPKGHGPCPVSVPDNG